MIRGNNINKFLRGWSIVLPFWIKKASLAFRMESRLYPFGSLVTPIILIMNHLLYLLSTKYDKMEKISL